MGYTRAPEWAVDPFRVNFLWGRRVWEPPLRTDYALYLPRARRLSRNGKSLDSASEAILALSYPFRQPCLDQWRTSDDGMPNENQATDLIEIIRTTRSIRRLKPDPVPNGLIRKILEAGVCAPSGGNMQRWRFLVVKDPKIKGTVGALYKRAWDEQVAHGTEQVNPPQA